MVPTPSKVGFYIGATCPGCGGELDLQSDFFSLVCPHCGSTLRVVMPDTPPAYVIPARKQPREIRFLIDRYLKQAGQPLTRSDFAARTIYYPYWKVDGIRLIVRRVGQPQPTADSGLFGDGSDSLSLARWSTEVTSSLAAETHSDSTAEAGLSPYLATPAAGPPREGIPASLGLRAEYVKMYPLSAEAGGEGDTYEPVTVSWETIATVQAKAVSRRAMLESASGVTQSRLFRPVGSIVYFPYFVAECGSSDTGRRFIVDGLTGRVLAVTNRSDLPPSDAAAETPGRAFGRLEVVFHRCANCGADLPATRSSVYICHNCRVVTLYEPNRALIEGIAVVECESHSQGHWFPFWSFVLPPEMIRKAAGVPVGVMIGDRLLVPGFRIAHFDAMRRLCRRMTCAAPRFATRPLEEQDQPHLPVTVSLSEAQSLAEVVLYCLEAAEHPRGGEAVTVAPERIGLVYVPFQAENYFMVDAALGIVTFEKSSVADQLV